MVVVFPLFTILFMMIHNIIHSNFLFCSSCFTFDLRRMSFISVPSWQRNTST